MRKAVGALFVAAMLACAARAQADPVSMANYSGFESRGAVRGDALAVSQETMSWSRFATEVREWVDDHEDADAGAFVSYVQARGTTARSRWVAHDEGEDSHEGLQFLHGLLNGDVKAAKAERFLARMQEIRKSGCLPRSPESPQIAATPEPASMLLLGTGVVGLVGLRRRKQQ